MWKKMSQLCTQLQQSILRKNFVIVTYSSKNVVKHRDAQEKSVIDTQYDFTDIIDEVNKC